MYTRPAVEMADCIMGKTGYPVTFGYELDTALKLVREEMPLENYGAVLQDIRQCLEQQEVHFAWLTGKMDGPPPSRTGGQS